MRDRRSASDVELRAAGTRHDRRLLYFVYNVNDPAVDRRLRMLRLGGLEDILVIGYRRSPDPVHDLGGTPVVDLGQTEDGRLVRRAASLARTRFRPGQWGRHLGPASAIMARGFEALILADAYRASFAPKVPLVYESLDVHRALLGKKLISRGLRMMEARALSRSEMLVTSSPAYVTEYFARLSPALPPVTVLENKVLAAEIGPALLARLQADRGAVLPPAGPPWRIGWFSQMRCLRSLELLASLCREFPGRIEVVMRGRPIAKIADSLVSVAAATPGMSFLGPYDRSTELAAIHSDVHFCWGLDFSDAGENSDWALANRLYEAGGFGCVPLAQAGVATGNWLTKRSAGVLLSEPYDESLRAWADALTTESYDLARAALLRVPLADFICSDDEAAAFVAQLVP